MVAVGRLFIFMWKRIQTAALALAATGLLQADFSYQELTRITGGSMAGAMKFVGKMGGGGLNNVESQVYLQGDKMARVDERSSTIIDLAVETITNVDLKNQRYSVVTFAQMKQAMEQAQAKAQAEMEKARRKNPDANVEISYSVDIQDPNRSETVAGYNAKEMILLITANVEDADENRSGAMNVATNMWLTKDVDGYRELQDFHKRMAEKLDWSPNSQMLSGMQQGFQMGDAMAKLQEHAASMEGIAVKQVMRMGGTAEGLEQVSSSDQQEVAEANEQSSLKQGLKGAFGGGLGGFGRKKKKKKEPEPSGDTGAMKASQAGVLIEMTMESSNFSSAPVPEEKLRVPAGFKQVESDLLKSLR